MSQENLEVVQRAFEMADRDGLEGIIKFIDMAWAPDGEMRATGRLPDAGPARARGRQELVEAALRGDRSPRRARGVHRRRGCDRHRRPTDRPRTRERCRGRAAAYLG